MLAWLVCGQRVRMEGYSDRVLLIDEPGVQLECTMSRALRCGVVVRECGEGDQGDQCSEVQIGVGQ